MSTHNHLSKEIQKLRKEKSQLERDEKVLREIIPLIKNQINAVQIEQLEIQNKQPAVLTDEYLEELATGQPSRPAAVASNEGSDILERMARGNFVIE